MKTNTQIYYRASHFILVGLINGSELWMANRDPEKKGVVDSGC